jgi:hypothetical protein
MNLPIRAPYPVQGQPPKSERPVYLVCPKCKRSATVHRFHTGEFVNETHHCLEHGNITPMRSAVVNDSPYTPDWSAA